MRAEQSERSITTASLVRLHKAWYVIAESKELSGKALLRRTLYGTPLVVFRNAEGRAAALLDRCPHRNVPLSGGQVVGPHVRCPYHGWEFDTEGVCRKVPGLCGIQEHKARNVPAYATLERDGYVWVWGERGGTPEGEPYAVPEVGKGYTQVRYGVEANGSVHAVIENALDVPHTAFLHGGLFRSSEGTKNDIQAVITRSTEGVQAEYIGEPRPPGLAARMLAPSGGTLTHFDRFVLPSVAQVEYRLGDEAHFQVTSLCTPVEDFRTKLWAIVQFRLGLIPGWLITPFLYPIALKIFRQDAVILEQQTTTMRDFGEELFVSTEIDLLGAQILRLMKRAAEGRNEPDDKPYRKEITLRV